VADGKTALAWVRSRTLQELVDGEWRAVAGEGDLARNLRQQQLLIEMLGVLKRFRSPQSLVDLTEDLDELLVLDENLSIPGAIGMAWDLRRLGPSSIQRPVIPVDSAVSPDGKFVRLPTESFTELLAAAYPQVGEFVGQTSG
jgi:hypothetical protein